MITVFAVNAVQGNGEMKMTKFEEEAIKEAEKSKVITKYYDGESTASDIGLNIKLGRATLNFPWLEFAKNWHSDEEYQESLKENNKLKSQIQQQALPVVPEFVAEWYEKYKANLDYYIYIFCKEFYEKTDCSGKELTKFENWFDIDSNQPIETLVRMKDGYQVEKPQLFKLIFPNSTAVLQKDGELNSFADTAYKRYLIKNAMTEQEIKLIDERYWQFAVPVEDGE